MNTFTNIRSLRRSEATISKLYTPSIFHSIIAASNLQQVNGRFRFSIVYMPNFQTISSLPTREHPLFRDKKLDDFHQSFIPCRILYQRFPKRPMIPSSAVVQEHLAKNAAP